MGREGDPLLWYYLVEASSAEEAEAIVRDGEIGKQVGPDAVMRVFKGRLG